MRSYARLRDASLSVWCAWVKRTKASWDAVARALPAASPWCLSGCTMFAETGGASVDGAVLLEDGAAALDRAEAAVLGRHRLG